MTEPDPCQHHAYGQSYGFARCADCDHTWVIHPEEFAAGQEDGHIDADGTLAQVVTSDGIDATPTPAPAPAPEPTPPSNEVIEQDGEPAPTPLPGDGNNPTTAV